MRYPTREEIQQLSPTERLQLIEDVWSTLQQDPATLPLPAEHQCEIDRRLDEWQRNPDAGDSWEDVRRRLAGEP